MKILIVDDETVIIRIVTHALKSIGVSAVGVTSPEQCLAVAEQETFDLAIVDINLPGMNGFELVKRLRKLPSMTDIPFIIFTARSDKDDQIRAADVGAVGFLYKPFSTHELRNLVLKHLQTA